jgi:hypothetical protein
MKKASVCEWTLNFQFKDEEQVRKFFSELIKSDFVYDFSLEKGLTETGEIYTVEISSLWAANLTHIAKILETVDYK